MFDEFMIATRNDEAASRMAVSIVDNYVEEGIRYGNAKRYSENKKDFIKRLLANKKRLSIIFIWIIVNIVKSLILNGGTLLEKIIVNL